MRRCYVPHILEPNQIANVHMVDLLDSHLYWALFVFLTLKCCLAVENLTKSFSCTRMPQFMHVIYGIMQVLLMPISFVMRTHKPPPCS